MKGFFSTNYSPNFSTEKRNSKNIEFIIIHYTGMSSEIMAISRLTDVKSKVSCHFFIRNNGKVILMVPLKYTAWHAGKSRWKNKINLNSKSIGVEIQNSGHENDYKSFNKKQIKSLIKVCKYLQAKFKVRKENILGHSDISYLRKKDPGEKFPWQILAKNKLSIWHDISLKHLKQFRNLRINTNEKNEFFLNLKKIGYFVNNNKKHKKFLIIAFQRKFRANLLNGIIDKECLIISKKLINT